MEVLSRGLVIAAVILFAAFCVWFTKELKEGEREGIINNGYAHEDDDDA